MQVFISWSGERSKLMAEALRGWLPKVIQSLSPWMSSQDIGAGARWLSEVSTTLNSTSVGLICITPENQHNPWLLFEAGALSKTIEQTCVCPLVFEMNLGQISGPLTQFQANSIDRHGVGKVLSTINEQLVDRKIDSQQLEEIFDVWWPKLEEKLRAIPAAPTAAIVRSTNDQLEELLSLTREQLRRENLRLEASKERDEKLGTMLDFMEKAGTAMGSLQGQASRMQAIMSKSADPAHATGIFPSATEGSQVIEMHDALKIVTGAPLDSKAINDVTELMRGMHERDKLRTDSMLKPPGDGQTNAN